MGGHLILALAIYACLGMAQGLAIYSVSPAASRMPVIAILILGAIFGTPVFLFGIILAAAREVA